jgi:predicted nucleotidyltransferase
MTIRQILAEKRNDILSIAARHGVTDIRIFGSAARGEEQPDSDVDFLVELEGGRSLLDLSVLWQDLEQLLGRKVHVVEPESLHWYVRDRILQEARPL